MGMNRVEMVGRLTRDAELRQTPSGTPVLAIGLAVNDRSRNQQTGEWEDRASFVDCIVFGNRATALSRILAKGSKVAVCGRLRSSSWERDGQRRTRLEVVVEDVELMQRPLQGTGPAAPHPDEAAADEDIPF